MSKTYKHAKLKRKHSHYRSWKSNKHWFYASSVLAALAGGTVLSQTNVQAATADGLDPQTAMTSATATSEQALSQVAETQTSALSSQVETVDSASNSVGQSQTVDSETSSNQSQAVSALRVSNIAVRTTYASSAEFSTASLASSTSTGSSSVDSSAIVTSAATVNALSDHSSSYASSAATVGSPTQVTVNDPFVTLSLSSLAASEATLETKKVADSYNSYAKLDSAQASSFMSSLADSAKSSMWMAQSSAGHAATVSTWSELVSAYSDETVKFIQISSGAVISSDATVSITTARHTSLIIDGGGATVDLGNRGFYLAATEGHEGQTFTLTNGIFNTQTGLQTENPESGGAVINAGWNPETGGTKENGVGDWYINVKDIVSTADELAQAALCQLTLAGNVEFTSPENASHLAVIGNTLVADNTTITFTEEANSWAMLYHAFDNNTNGYTTTTTTGTGQGELSYIDGSGKTQIVAASSGGTDLWGNNVTVNSTVDGTGYPLIEGVTNIVIGDYFVLNQNAGAAIFATDINGGKDNMDSTDNDHSWTIGQYATINVSGLGQGGFMLVGDGASNELTINHGATINISTTGRYPLFVGTESVINILSPSSIVLNGSDGTAPAVYGNGQVNLSHTRLSTISPYNNQTLSAEQEALNNFTSTELIYSGIERTINGVELSASSWNGWMDYERIIENVSNTSPTWITKMDLVSGEPGDITLNYVDFTGKVVGTVTIPASTATSNLPGNVSNLEKPRPGDIINALDNQYLVNDLPSGYIWAAGSQIPESVIEQLQSDELYAQGVDIYGIEGYKDGQLLNMIVPVSGSSLTYYIVVVGMPSEISYQYVDEVTGLPVEIGSTELGKEGIGSYDSLSTANVGNVIDFTNDYYTSTNLPEGYIYVTKTNSEDKVQPGQITVTEEGQVVTLYVLSKTASPAITVTDKTISAGSSINLLEDLDLKVTNADGTVADFTAVTITVDGLATTDPIFTSLLTDPTSQHTITYSYIDPLLGTEVTKEMILTVAEAGDPILNQTDLTMKAGETLDLLDGLSGFASDGTSILNFDKNTSPNDLANLVILVDDLPLEDVTSYTALATASAESHLITYIYTDPLTLQSVTKIVELKVSALPIPVISTQGEINLTQGDSIDLIKDLIFSGTNASGELIDGILAVNAGDLKIYVDGVLISEGSSWLTDEETSLGLHTVAYIYTDPVTGYQVSETATVNVQPKVANYVSNSNSLIGSVTAEKNQSLSQIVQISGNLEAANTTVTVISDLYLEGTDIIISSSTATAVFDANGNATVVFNFSNLNLTTYANKNLIAKVVIANLETLSNTVLVSADTKITSVESSYQQTNSSNRPAADDVNWSKDMPTAISGKYIWTKTVTHYADGTSSISYTVAYQGLDGLNATGTNGDNGINGRNTSQTHLQSQKSLASLEKRLPQTGESSSTSELTGLGLMAATATIAGVRRKNLKDKKLN
ncbi:MAG: KxYKxGKxW signal peptide domain-containing protein [Lactovum sp.]